MNLDEVINRFKNQLLTVGIHGSLLHVGSSLNKKNFNDIDLLLVVDDIDLAISKIYECFSNYQLIKSDDAIKILNFCAFEVSIAIYRFDKISEIVNDFYTGTKVLCEHRTWATGYWLAEAFINDLTCSNIIFDYDDKIETIKDFLIKKSCYGEKKVLIDCFDEIKSKMQIKDKNDICDLEFNLAKNDIVLAMIRSSFILSNQKLRSFKNIEQVIKMLPIKYQDIINSFIISSDNNYLNIIIDEIFTKISCMNNIYMGTWQFSGDFKKLTDNEIIDLIEYAKSMGIHNFDTALVYGNGNVEKTLSRCTDGNDKITTKIPAKRKPHNDECCEITEFYDSDYMKDCVKKSLNNLERIQVETILLHNWNRNWNECSELLDWLTFFKENGYCNKIGISLPNGYNEVLPDKILKYIDVIEAPYNDENKWIIKDIKTYKMYGIEIILRSLFLQGKCLQLDKSRFKSLLTKANSFNTSLVIGMTTSTQIDDNLKVLKRR